MTFTPDFGFAYLSHILIRMQTYKFKIMLSLWVQLMRRNTRWVYILGKSSQTDRGKSASKNIKRIWKLSSSQPYNRRSFYLSSSAYDFSLKVFHIKLALYLWKRLALVKGDDQTSPSVARAFVWRSLLARSCCIRSNLETNRLCVILSFACLFYSLLF